GAELAAQVNPAAMDQRRGHIGRVPCFAPLLVPAAGADHPLGIGFDTDHGTALGRGDHDQIGRGQGGGDEAQGGVVAVLGVEVADAPDLGAVAQAVGDGIVVAVGDEVGGLATWPDGRRGIGVFALVVAVALALDLPDLFAVGLVEGND